MGSNNYWKVRPALPLLLASLLPLPALLGQGASHLTVQEPPALAAKRGATAHSALKVSLQPGYHCNSNTPSEDYLIPLKLTWNPGPLEAPAVQYPKAQMEKYEFSKKPISVFSGDFEVVTTFKVPANAAVGPGMMTGKLRYQACNDKSCFPPKTVEIRLPVQIQ